MAFGDKLRGRQVRSAKFIPDKRNFSVKARRKYYQKVLVVRSLKASSKLISNNRKDDDNVGAEAVRKTTNYSAKIFYVSKKRQVKNNSSSAIKRKIRKKHKDEKNNFAREGILQNDVRRYSDKVFDQAKYNFKKRQREVHEEMKQQGLNAVSFFEKARKRDLESIYKSSTVEYGSFSDKLKISKKEKTKKSGKHMYESTLEVKDSVKGEKKKLDKLKYEEQTIKSKKIQDKLNTDKMNQHMQFERRYKQMQEKIDTVNFISKQSIKRLTKEIKSYAAVIGALSGVFLILYILTAGSVSMFIGAVGGGGMASSTTSMCWNSTREDIDAVDEYFYLKFEELQKEIQDLIDAPDHDITEQNVKLEYNHFAVVSYISALYDGKFTYSSDIENQLDILFNQMFSYTYEIKNETRQRKIYDPDIPGWVMEDYEADVLYIDISIENIEDIANSSLNDEQKAYYEATMSIEGGLQAFGAPTNNWRHDIIDYYTSDNGALTIDTSENKAVFGLMNGTVVDVGSDYIIVEDDKGSGYKLDGIKNIVLSKDEETLRGIKIAETTDELSVSVWINGYVVNPLFYLREN